MNFTWVFFILSTFFLGYFLYNIQIGEIKGEYKKEFLYDYDTSVGMFLDLKRLAKLNPLVIDFKVLEVDSTGFIRLCEVIDLISNKWIPMNVTYTIERSILQKDKKITKFKAKIKGKGIWEYVLNIDNEIQLTRVNKNTIELYETSIFKLPNLLLQPSLNQWKDSHEIMYEKFLRK